MFIIIVPKRQKNVEPHALLAGQSRLLGDLQARDGPYLKNKKSQVNKSKNI